MKRKATDVTDQTTVVMPRRRFGLLIPKLSRKSWSVVAGVLVLALLAYGGYKVYLGGQSVCSDAVLEQAAGALEAVESGALQPVAENIMQFKRFDRDPDCLYVVVVHHVNVGEPERARHYFEKLKRVYKPEVGFSEKLGDNLKSVADLEAEVALLEKKSEENKNNLQMVPNAE